VHDLGKKGVKDGNGIGMDAEPVHWVEGEKQKTPAGDPEKPA